mgnify:CR=1 FL=1
MGIENPTRETQVPNRPSPPYQPRRTAPAKPAQPVKVPAPAEPVPA